MIEEGLQLKITLNRDETEALKILSETTCGGVNCIHCPFMLNNTNGRCLKTLAQEVKEQFIYDPRNYLAYTTVKLNN